MDLKKYLNSMMTAEDRFLEMPPTTQELYFHLVLSADRSGFIKDPQKIQRNILASDIDLDLLYKKGFLVRCETDAFLESTELIK